jgi:outer membrane lipoprotein-sorting protein
LTKRPSTVGFAQLLCALLIVALIMTCGAVAAAAEQESAEQLLSLMRGAMLQPKRVSFTQDVDITGILGRWRFSATVERNGNAVIVQAKGAPSFIPPDLLADLADFEKALAGFSLEYGGKEQVSEKTYFVLRGVRRPQLHSGAIEGRIWIDEHEHLMRRTEARYNWGTVRVSHTYTLMKGFMVLAQQEASISPFATRLTITYRDYRLGN